MDTIVNEDDYEIPCPKRPFHVAVDVDQTCNLRCKYCRDEIHINKEDNESLGIVTAKILEDVVPYCGELMLAGNGEVFASKYYQKILYAPNIKMGGQRLKLQLTTNAILLDESKLQKLTEIYSHIELWISIDAASRAKYEEVRRGGCWETLLENLATVKKYRQEKRVHYLRFNFIVTSKSCYEMHNFVEMAKQFAADSVLFQKLEHTNVLSDEEYDTLSIFDSEGNIKDAYHYILEDPILDDPIVNRQNNVLSGKREKT